MVLPLIPEIYEAAYANQTWGTKGGVMSRGTGNVASAYGNITSTVWSEEIVF